jgi:hypothetical protein
MLSPPTLVCDPSAVTMLVPVVLLSISNCTWPVPPSGSWKSPWISGWRLLTYCAFSGHFAVTAVGKLL